MVPSFFRSYKDRYRQPSTNTTSSSPFFSHSQRQTAPRVVLDSSRRVAADYDDEELDHDDGETERNHEAEEDEEHDAEDSEGGEDGLTPLLPIFEAAHLDALPVYNLTHAIRLLVVPRCETTLTWDQLRSPQISQFMVKPIQSNILTSHFSRATLYALMANCLQFTKEAAENPGNSGTSRTRALVCELLAMRLLKEYSVRELIDALSYDFFPLQGLNVTNPHPPTMPMQNWEATTLNKQQARVARISALEIAIRSQAKRFLAHPLVVQQLEAIWAGTIVFHSAADNAHRPRPKMTPNQNRGYGAIGSRPVLLAAQNEIQPAKQRDHRSPVPVITRRTVTLYDPREASLFKLSRLRVPRYRSFFSTCSLAVLLGLFVAVLAERSVNITVLEVIFWFWSAGFMLDEVVGLTDQGFNLYLLSFWNSFDLGILLILVIFYCLRIYGLVIADDGKLRIAHMAYDVLAVNAILLFPRLFSVLDHYRYFSQLLIAFRMMARDLVALLVLLIISCSGFFVAFTLSFGNDELRAGGVAYTLFQIIMGYSPAAWDKWAGYNVLGQSALVLFLILTHFLVVTILITVLTNSFMAIVQNANDEHQFVFAINTISMVKSDALFSYIAPTNILAWVLTPLRSCLPYRQYIRLNRTAIKVTHFPLLFGICAYERLLLKGSVYEATDLIEQRGRERTQLRAFNTTDKVSLFSPKPQRARERSVATHQDQALDAVFRRPLRHQESAITRGTDRGSRRRPKSENIDTWFSKMGPENPASPPPEQDRRIVDRLERPYAIHRRSTPRRQERRNITAASMSIASDPEDFMSNTFERPPKIREEHEWLDAAMDDSLHQAAEDGDDELVTQHDHDVEEASHHSKALADSRADPQDYFQYQASANPQTHQPAMGLSQTPEDRIISFTPKPSPPAARQVVHKARRSHQRNPSTTTILYNPVANAEGSSSAGQTIIRTRDNPRPKARLATPPKDPEDQEPPPLASRKTPKRSRPIMPDRKEFQSAPNLAGLLRLEEQRRNASDRGTSFQMDLISDLGDNKAVGGQFVGGMPASFATHMGFLAGRPASEEGEDQRRMGKLMLARMNTLEEGFREVIKEVKDWKRGSDGTMTPAPPMTPRRGGDRERLERVGKMARALGKKRREGEWVEERGAASGDGDGVERRDYVGGERGSSV